MSERKTTQEGGTERVFSAAEHLAAEDITDMDAPGEPDEPAPEMPQEQATPQRKTARRGKTPAAPTPQAEKTPHKDVTGRRPATNEERAEAARRTDEKKDELESSWLTRAQRTQIRADIQRYESIAASGFIDSSSPSDKPKGSTSGKRPEAQVHDEEEFSDVDEFGQRPHEVAFLKRRQQAYIDQHPGYFKGDSRRRPDPDLVGSDGYPRERPKRQPRRKRPVEQHSDVDDYEAVERANERMLMESSATTGHGTQPTQQTYAATPPRQPAIYSPYQQPPTPSPYQQPPPSHPHQRAQPQTLSPFDQRLATLTSGQPAVPRRHYPPGFDNDLPLPSAFGTQRPQPRASVFVHIEGRRRPGPAAQRPTGQSGFIRNTTGRDIASGPAMDETRIQLDRAFGYGSDIGKDTEEEEAGEGAKEGR
ncbi:MAG: hypothetical protein LQ338_005077 [Usnochroma carphineum]|nr:MAG: hypothetical protein LQ338_005077 [Usnochroma carphineum]